MRRRPLYKSKVINLTVGLAVTLICFGWALYVMGAIDDPRGKLHEVSAAFGRAHYWMLLPIWLVLFVFFWLKSWRWRMLLASLGDYRPMRELFPPIMVGFAFNNLLPAHLGDIVRVVVFGRQQRLPFMAVLSSVGLERIFDAVAILGFLGVGLFLVPGVDDRVRGWTCVAAVVICAAVAAAVVYLVWTRPFVRFVLLGLKLCPFLSSAWRQSLADFLEAGAIGLAALKSGRLLAGIVATSLLQWALNGLLTWLCLKSFDIDVTAPVIGVLLGVVAFGVAVPSSPGYFGVIQALFVLVLGFFVDDREGVFAASIYYHMAQWVPVTLIGLYFFNRSGLKVSDVEQEAEQGQAAGEPQSAART